MFGLKGGGRTIAGGGKLFLLLHRGYSYRGAEGGDEPRPWQRGLQKKWGKIL